MEIFSMFHYISLYGENIQVTNHTTEKNYTLNFHWHKYNASLPALNSTSNCVCAWGAQIAWSCRLVQTCLVVGQLGVKTGVYHVPWTYFTLWTMCSLYVLPCVLLVMFFRNRTHRSCSLNILTSCLLNIFYAMLRSWYAIWAMCSPYAMKCVLIFLRWEIHYAKYVENVSELRNIMWYAMACVNLTGLFSWV